MEFNDLSGAPDAVFANPSLQREADGFAKPDLAVNLLILGQMRVLGCGAIAI
jgi:hypothetical protein